MGSVFHYSKFMKNSIGSELLFLLGMQDMTIIF